MQLSRAAWGVVRRERALLALPVIGAVTSLVVFVFFSLPAWLLLRDDWSTGTSTVDPAIGGDPMADPGGASFGVGLAEGLFVGLAVLAAMWVTALFQAAVIAGAGQHLDGQRPTIRSSLAAASDRSVWLLGWAMLSFAVTTVLRTVEERLGLLGKLFSFAASVAFSIVSFLTLPVIVFEHVGPIRALQRSAALVRTTWGEQLAFNLGLSAVALLLLVPGAALAAVLVASGLVVLQVVALIIGVVWLAAVAAAMSAMNGVFKTVLYRHATGRPLGPDFDARVLERVFVAR